MAERTTSQTSGFAGAGPGTGAASHRARRFNAWTVSTLVIALLVAMPVLVILAHVFGFLPGQWCQNELYSWNVS